MAPTPSIQRLVLPVKVLFVIVAAQSSECAATTAACGS